MEKINIDTLTPEQLKQLEQQIEAKKEAKRKEKLAARKNYETERDQMVNSLVKDAIDLHDTMSRFKAQAFHAFEQLRSLAAEYGDIPNNSKGGFSLRASDTKVKAALERNLVFEYDERCDLALNLLREFLEETIKKKDQQMYRTISTLLNKNTKGDMNPARVAELLKIKDNYADERWVKAMQLLQESYQEREVSYNVAFYVPDPTPNKDALVSLSFPSIPVAVFMPNSENVS